WKEAGALMVAAIEKAISEKIVTYDFARLMDNPTEVSTSAFGDAIIERL
ncbi:MAG: NADP-dependent isocitrate dehydrogenase, partial [Acidimicrobiia bacterium]|nr:NADP-dependent isocitrate dehydrogenase [Acidimicrobiia bacterium]